MTPKCIATMRTGYRVYQCLNPAKVTIEGQSYCGMHDPNRINKTGMSRMETIKKRTAMRGECERAIRVIAAGYNDPRTLALAVLEKYK